MIDWQSQQVDESRDLIARMQQLLAAMGLDEYRAAPLRDREMMVSQLQHMLAYHGILIERIARYNDEGEK